MKRTLILLVFVVTILGGYEGKLACTARAQEVPVSAGTIVDLVLLERTTTRLRFQMKVSNTGEKSILVVTDPVRLDGSEGAYVSLNEKNQSQLDLAFAVYPPPVYTRLAPKTRVTFRRLEPGGTYQTEIVLNSPLQSTKPPWGDTPHTERIDVAKVQQVVANVGILPDDPGIHAALVNVRSPDGFEMVSSGPFERKALFTLQIIVTSKLLKLY